MKQGHITIILYSLMTSLSQLFILSCVENSARARTHTHHVVIKDNPLLVVCASQLP